LNLYHPTSAAWAILLLFVFQHSWRSEANAEIGRRPNFLILLTDDQRADTIREWGNPHIDTPHLDRLAKRGMNFRANYCCGGNSGAVCVPSRAMLLSGRYWLHTPLDLNQVKILPELLGENGYTTFATGKWHNGAESFVRGFQRGRAVFFGGMCDHTLVPLRDLADGRLTSLRIGDRFSSELFADAAIDFLESYQGDTPFFAYVAFTAPHDPRQPPLPFRRMYYERRAPLPLNFLPQSPFDNGFTTGRDEELAPWPRTKEVISDQLAEYYGMITHLDEQIGRIIDALERGPHAGNTYVVFASDQGLALGSHGLLGKQNVYEHSMRSPLIIAGPRIPSGQRTHALTYLLDLFPTICQLAGIKPPDGIAGHDLLPLARGEATSVRDSIFLPYMNLMRAVRDTRWKLIRYPPINHTELFDLEHDPHEMSNLAGDPKYIVELERMTDLLKKWQAETGDQQPLASDRPRPKELNLDGYRRIPDPWQPAWIVEKYFGHGDP
jgi:arylsulfatase A-like enzyme